MEKKFLPIGSVVLLKDGTKKVMVTGFCPIPRGQTEMYDYVGCLYPEGVIESDKNLVFNHDQINEIVFSGYVDDEEKAFKVKLDEELKKDEEKSVAAPTVENKEETKETPVEEVNEAPSVESNEVPSVEPSNFDVPSLDSIIGTSNNESNENIETF